MLTHCDRLAGLPPEGATHENYAYAASAQLDWIKGGIERHQSGIPEEKRRLRVQESIMCISSVSGGEASLLALRSKLEGILQARSPPHLHRISPASHLHLTCISGASRQVRALQL